MRPLELRDAVERISHRCGMRDLELRSFAQLGHWTIVCARAILVKQLSGAVRLCAVVLAVCSRLCCMVRPCGLRWRISGSPAGGLRSPLSTPAHHAMRISDITHPAYLNVAPVYQAQSLRSDRTAVHGARTAARWM